MRTCLGALAAMSALLPSVAAAQSGTVSASNAEGMARTLSEAGYSVTTETDSYGDPLLIADFNGYEGQVIFYGCDEGTHDGCDSVQFTVGLDRRDPMPLAMVNDLLANERFISISLDEEGDPWVTWDVVTLGGIPADVFLHAVGQFSAQVELVADTVFSEEDPGV